MHQPTEQWRSVFQGEVLRALDDCLDARRHISDANRDQAEVLGPYADADADKLRSAAENIAKASRCLSASMAHMGAAEFLALRGCGRIPTEPVASAKLLHDGDDVRLALAKLQSAREHGQDAHTRLRECGGRVQGVAFMLGGLPGAPFPAPHARASIESEISAVARELCYAHDRTVSMTALYLRHQACRPHPVTYSCSSSLILRFYVSRCWRGLSLDFIVQALARYCFLDPVP